jgi:hypothetical protein
MLSLIRALFLILGGHEQVAMENLALREQLEILQRSNPRPRIRTSDRLCWVCLQKVWKAWKWALVIVRPETVVDWQRRRFKRYWSRLSQHQNAVRVWSKNSILLRSMVKAAVASNGRIPECLRF